MVPTEISRIAPIHISHLITYTYEMPEKSCTWWLSCICLQRKIWLLLTPAPMSALTYIRLIGFTAGTLLMLFWMVVILGYRRQRNFERVFFFLCLALFLFYSGSLLALNAQIYYPQPPPLLTTFAWTVLYAGLCFAPAFLVHLHLEYASTRGLIIISKGDPDQWKRLMLTFVYAGVLLS